MNSKSNFVVALSFGSLGASSALVGCTKEAQPTPAVSASNNASSQLSATEKAEAERAAADKAVRDKVATDKTAADKAAAHTKAESASLPAGLVETKAEITLTMAQMDVTMAKLDSLAVASGDLDDPSESALASIDTLESEIKALQKRAETMRDRGAAYFEAWDKQLAAMSAPEVVELAT
jgi:colicin import membrane protein